MGNPLLMLVLGLAGAGMMIAALAMILRGHAARRRGAGGWLTAPGLLAVGAALTAAAWLLPGKQAVDPETEFNRLLSQTPSAAGPKPAPRFNLIGLRVAGTPSDRDEASPSEQHAYSAKLAAALGEAVVNEGVSARVDAQALPSEAWPGTETLGDCHGQDLLVTIRLPAVALPDRNDFALWREPSFELLWCHSGTRQSERFKVLERPGDHVPYEQAVRNRLLTMLRRTPKS